METIKTWLSKSYLMQYEEVAVLKNGDRLFSGNVSALRSRDNLLNMGCEDPLIKNGVLTFCIK